jgi:hypothetical protein
LKGVVSMEPIFNMFKVKYAKLDEIITKGCPDIQADSKINLFINLEPILRKLTASDIDKYLRVKKDEKIYEMVSNIVNLAAHYRLFFSKNKLYSNVYIYVGYPFNAVYKNADLQPNYRKTYQHKYTKDPKSMVLGHVLNEVIPLTKTILEYVKGVYLIESNTVETSVIPQVITNESNDNYLNFMLTTDRYEYQYTNHNFYIIRPKQDHSYLLNKDNVIDLMKLEDKIVNDIRLPSSFVPFILSLLGDKYRNIEKIKRIGIGNILKMIRQAIDMNIISSNVTNINVLAEVLKEDIRSQVMENYYLTDIVSQYQVLNMKGRYSITSQLVDKFDNVSLKKINEEEFYLYPMYIMELTHANNLQKPRHNFNIFGG